MAKKSSSYSFLLSSLFLGAVATLQFLTALPLIHSYKFYEVQLWMPLFSGIIDFEFLSPVASTLLVLFITAINAVVLLRVNSTLLNDRRNRVKLISLYAILLLLLPETLFFSGATVASLLLLISLYREKRSSKNEAGIIESALYLSIAILFEPILLLTLPFIFLLFLLSNENNLKSILLYLTSLLLFPLLLSIVRYLLFNDLAQFFQLYLQRISTISITAIRLDSPAIVVILALSLFLTFRVLFNSLSKVTKYPKRKGEAVKYITTLFIVQLFTLILYIEQLPQLLYIIAPYGALLLKDWLFQTKSKGDLKLNFTLILLITLVLLRIAQFMGAV